MSLCQVLQIYTDHTDGVWSNMKPALCFRGHKHTHCVVIGFPVHVVRREGRDFDTLEPTKYQGRVYPVDRMVKHLRRAGKQNGITVAARKLLDTVADGKATFPMEEGSLQLTEEDDTMEMAKDDSQPTAGDQQPKEKEVATKAAKKKAPKGNPKKQTKPAKVPMKKGAKAAKAKSERKPGIGDLMRELIKDGKDNEQVLAAVKKKFPDSQAKASSVAWHRCQMKKK